MADLILLNGPPASGKSTLAVAMVARRPLALNLDVDFVRGLLGGWMDRPVDAGLNARQLAAAMAAVNLTNGFDVIVPQFLARDDFIYELEKTALGVGARFVEVALIMDRAEAIKAFSERSAGSINQQHRDAQEMVERAGGVAALADMYDEFVRLIDSRFSVRRVEVLHGDVLGTLERVEQAIARQI
jgi:predicted kinase